MNHTDSLKWTPVATVEKFDPDQVDYVARKSGILEPSGDLLSAEVDPWETVSVEGNQLTTAGLDRLTKLTIGTAVNAMTSAFSRLGVGDNAAAFALTDAALTTGTASWFQGNDATYPQQSNGVITSKCTIVDPNGNFAWACWGIDIGASNTAGQPAAACLLNRKVAALGTKVSGTWVLTVTVTLS